MELTYDWKVLQAFFWLRRKHSKEKPAAPIFLILDSNSVTEVYSDGEDLTDWIGATFDAVVGEFSHREWVVFHREKVDQLLNQSLGLTHFYDQIQFVRKNAKPTRTHPHSTKNHGVPFESHFLLNAVE